MEAKKFSKVDKDWTKIMRVSPRLLRCLHVVAGTRIMVWVVSFSSSGRFGPRRGRRGVSERQRRRDAVDATPHHRDAPRRQVSQSTSLVVPCCQNEMLKAKLPEMYGELEKCSKALEGYLEQKRSKFPRFYFCSNSKLLQILSQGSDPTTMNAHYETVFDALEKVDHDKKDKVSDSA